MNGRTESRWTVSLLRLFAVPAVSLVTLVTVAESPRLGELTTPKDEPRKTQRTDRLPPPSAPEDTPVDPGILLPPLPPVSPPGMLHVRREKESASQGKLPSQFNPDPGGVSPPTRSAMDDAYFTTEVMPANPKEPASLPPGLDTSRGNLDRPLLDLDTPVNVAAFSNEPVPADLRLPRSGVRENHFIQGSWRAPTTYPLTQAGVGYPANTVPTTDRWHATGFQPWQRYSRGDANELPYAHPEPELWHYYRQSVLKGDLPIRGQDLFLNLTATGEVTLEDRTLTVTRKAATPGPGNFGTFAHVRTQLWLARFGLQADLFRGETVFKPVDWLIRLRPVFSFNHSPARSGGVVSLGPRGNSGANSGGSPEVIDPANFTYAARPARNQSRIFLQEAFVEKHLRDLSPNYDFVSVRLGNQSFNSDFRGFVFNETNFGARLFGNYGSNRWQYNVAVFDLREKDLISELNTLSRRGQVVAIANVYRQDFWKKGYTAQFSVHASFDEGGTHHNVDGINVRPAPLGTVQPHRVTSYYLGWTGDGHLDRWNLSHAAYLVVGHDGFNGLAGQPVDIFAHMAAIELSYDWNWIRIKASALYASGDHHAGDGRATGFDSIIDNTNFAGGPFGYYARQGIGLGPTAVGLKPRLSLFPDLRTSKTASQQNFVNPGLALIGTGVDLDLTPKLKVMGAANLLRFVTTDPIKLALGTERIDSSLGVDLSLGLQWRPRLTNNVVISAGYGVLLPGRGYRDSFTRAQSGSRDSSGTSGDAMSSEALHSAVFSIGLTY